MARRRSVCSLDGGRKTGDGNDGETCCPDGGRLHESCGDSPSHGDVLDHIGSKVENKETDPIR